MPNANPNRRRQDVIWSTMAGSVLQMRRIPPLWLPSASKIPPRKPLRHSSDGDPGQPMMSSTEATPARVDERQAKPVNLPVSPAEPRIRVGADVPVAADHPAQVATSIVRPTVRRCREPARSHQLVVACQVRPPVRAMLGAGDVLPSPVAQEPVVAAGHQLRPVLECDPVGGL